MIEISHETTMPCTITKISKSENLPAPKSLGSSNRGQEPGGARSMHVIGNKYKILVGKPDGKRLDWRRILK
jgi:hypothetical protein